MLQKGACNAALLLKPRFSATKQLFNPTHHAIKAHPRISERQSVTSAHSRTAISSSIRAMAAPAQKVKIALCQLPVGRNKAVNLQQAKDAIKEAAANGAQLVVLPEMWTCPYRNDDFPEYAEPVGPDGKGGPAATLMAEAAAANKVTLIGGSIPEKTNDDGGVKIYNTCCIYGPNGKLLGVHRKVHLFDIDIPGKIMFKESDTLAAGNQLTIVDTPQGRVGVGICYDVRFAEMAMLYAQQGAQLIVYPGAFNTTTGPLHWELLLRARALDNQLYIAGCGPARNESSGFTAWGHSTVIGPFAEVVAATDEKPGILYAELDYAQVAERRANIPIRSQKRNDLYAVVDPKS